jgi:thiamine-phosphate pyrophosphorylase
VKLAIAAESLNKRAGGRAARLPALFCLTDEKRMADPIAVARSLPRGTGIILRHYGVPNRVALAHMLSRIARARGLVLLIAADARLARAVGAAGVHFPEALLAHRRHFPGRRLLVTAAAHSPRAIFRARMIGVDAVLLSPVFPTESGEEKKPLGALRFAQWTRAAGIPVYALGGIDEASALRLKESGAAGLAGIGSFIRASKD